MSAQDQYDNMTLIPANDGAAEPFQPKPTYKRWMTEDLYLNREGTVIRTGLYLADRREIAIAMAELEELVQEGVAFEIERELPSGVWKLTVGGVEEYSLSDSDVKVNFPKVRADDLTYIDLGQNDGIWARGKAFKMFGDEEFFGIVTSSNITNSTVYDEVTSVSFVLKDGKTADVSIILVPEVKPTVIEHLKRLTPEALTAQPGGSQETDTSVANFYYDLRTEDGEIAGIDVSFGFFLNITAINPDPTKVLVQSYETALNYPIKSGVSTGGVYKLVQRPVVIGGEIVGWLSSGVATEPLGATRTKVKFLAEFHPIGNLTKTGGESDSLIKVTNHVFL